MARTKNGPSEEDVMDKVADLIGALHETNRTTGAALVERLEAIEYAANFGGDDEGYSLGDADALKGMRLYLCGLHTLDFLEDDAIETKYAAE